MSDESLLNTGVQRLISIFKNPENWFLPVYMQGYLAKPLCNPKCKRKKLPQERFIYKYDLTKPCYKTFNRRIDKKLRILLEKANQRKNARVVFVTINFSKQTQQSFLRDDTCKNMKEPSKAFAGSLRERGLREPTIVVLEGSNRNPAFINHGHLITITEDKEALRKLLRKYAKPRLNKKSNLSEKRQNNAIVISETYEYELELKGITKEYFEIECEQFGYPPEEYLISDNYWINAKYKKETEIIIEGETQVKPAKLTRRLPVDAGSGFYLSKQLDSKLRIKERVAFISL